jgi:hypothetical protein
MSNNKNRVADKLARMQKETGEARVADPIHNADLVTQLTHEDAGEPNFADIAKKLQKRQEAEKEPSFLESTVKFTIYVDADVAAAFKALCIERGDQRRFATQAFSDFVTKKIKELGL